MTREFCCKFLLLENKMLVNLITVIHKYTCQIMLYTLNMHNCICQLYLNITRGKKRKWWIILIHQKTFKVHSKNMGGGGKTENRWSFKGILEIYMREWFKLSARKSHLQKKTSIQKRGVWVGGCVCICNTHVIQKAFKDNNNFLKFLFEHRSGLK